MTPSMGETTLKSIKEEVMLELAALRFRAKHIKANIDNHTWGVDWVSSGDLNETKSKIKELERELKQR